MDQFPVDFNLGYLQEYRKQQESAEGEVQKDLLKKVRQMIYLRYMTALKERQNEIIIPVDELSMEGKRVIVKELCNAFPGKIMYRNVIEYADVDEFRLIENPENPNISFEYKLKL